MELSSRTGCFAPGEGTPISVEYWAGWDKEPFQTYQRREKSLNPAGMQTPDRLGRSTVAILTVLKPTSHYFR
jgi:hypothetical protein